MTDRDPHLDPLPEKGEGLRKAFLDKERDPEMVQLEGIKKFTNYERRLPVRLRSGQAPSRHQRGAIFWQHVVDCRPIVSERGIQWHILACMTIRMPR
jgi:hypothetical protein